MNLQPWLERRAPAVAEWLKRRDLKMLAGLLLIALLGWTFVAIADFVAEGESQTFDHMVLRALRADVEGKDPLGPMWLERAMLDITALGGGTIGTLVVILVFGFLLLARKPRAALLVAACGIGTALFIHFLKAFFERGRPNVVTAVYTADGLSFPSGHATISAALYITLAVLVAGTLQKRRLRLYVVGAAALLAFLIGFSRVYLGVHYPSDVLAGWTLGVAWALACGLVERTLQRRGKVERAAPEEAPETLASGSHLKATR